MRWTSNLKLRQAEPKLHALNPNKQTVEDDKHNPQDKTLLLNPHNKTLT